MARHIGRHLPEVVVPLLVHRPRVRVPEVKYLSEFKELLSERNEWFGQYVPSIEKNIAEGKALPWVVRPLLTRMNWLHDFITFRTGPTRPTSVGIRK